MEFELIFDKKIITKMQKFPVETRKRIFSKLQKSKINPLTHFIRLSGRLDYKLSVGDHRAIVFLDLKKKQIQVVKVGHRRNIYKK